MHSRNQDRSVHAAQAMAAGNKLLNDGKVEEAAEAFSRAALLRPDVAQGHNNLGVLLRRQGKTQAAVACYRRGLELAPGDGGLYSNLGNALRELGHLEESVAALRRAVELQPDSASFAFNLALALRDARRLDEALPLMERLAAAHPDNGDYAWDLALTRLQMTDYVEGFKGYEARWRLARSPERILPGPRLEADSEVAGKTVVLLSEQGFGDALQFARFVPILARRGCRIVLECQPELKGLLAGLPGVVAVVDKHAALPAHDFWAPMLSLARILGVSWETLPAEVPYLKPPRPLAQKLDRPPGCTVKAGLVWAGKTTPRDRSWPLEKLVPLLGDPRVAFYSLQLGPRAGDLAATGMNCLIRDLSPHLKSFADTAAVMADLDLIVTIDTSVAHLAGALGRPAWVLLRYVSDWRWLDEPEDCRWYPSLRLFRQADPFDFDRPVAKMAAELRRVLDARDSSAPLGG
jgi:Tfp pilus assembly protein PilF